MKPRLLFLILAMTFLFPAIANAALNDAYAYFSFDNADNVGENKLKDLANVTHNATNNTADFGRTLVLGEAYELGGSPDWIALNKRLGSPSTDFNFTYVVWFNTSDGVTDASLIRPVSGTGDTAMMWSVTTNNRIKCLADLSVNAGNAIATSDTVGVMTMAVCRYNGTHMNVYINKTLEASDPASGDIDINTDIFIGKHSSNVEYFTGYIDELGIWMRDIDKGCNDVGEVCTGEIADLFNDGAGFNPYAAVAGPGNDSNFTITVIDAYNGTAISDFTAIVFNSTDIFINTTTKGNITFDNLSGIYNISINTTMNGGYFNITIGNIDVSSDFQAAIYQAILYINVSEIITNTKLNTFTVNSTLQGNASNSTGWAKLYLKAGNYNISASATGYLDWWTAVNISNMQAKYANVSLGTGNFTIRAKNVLDGSTIENFTIVLEYASPTYIYKINISTKNESAFESHNDSIVFRTIAGNYNLTISAPTYASGQAKVTVNTGDLYPNYTFSVYTTNSINFSVYDEFNRELLLKNVSIKIISDAFSSNYSTDTGSLYIDLLQPSEYRITFSTNGYTQRNYFFTLTNGSNNLIELYLLSAGNGTAVNLYLTDKVDNPLIGYYSYLTREFIINNASVYKTLEIEKTDDNGLIRHDMVLNDAFYQWTFRNTKKEVVKTTEKQQVFLTTLFYRLKIEDDYLEQYTEIGNISSSLSHNNATGVITFIYSGSSGLSADYCLKVEKLTTFSFSKVSDVCQTSSTGSMTYTLTDFDANYIATGYVRASGSIAYNTILTTKEILYKTDWKTFSATGLLLDGIFIMTLATAGFVMSGIVGSIIFSVVGLGIFSLIGFVALRLIVYISIVIYALVLIFKMRGNGR